MLFLKDNYLEEAMKMRNLLEEFRADHGLRPPTILGVREHVFTGRYVFFQSSLYLLKLIINHDASFICSFNLMLLLVYGTVFLPWHGLCPTKRPAL